MGWIDKIFDGVQTAAVIGERVEKLGTETASLAANLRDLEHRVSRLEGYVAAMSERASRPRLPPKK